MHRKPRVYFNITPINPNGITVVDLGELPEDEGLEVTRGPSPKPSKTMPSNPAEGLHEVSEGEADASAVS